MVSLLKHIARLFKKEEVEASPMKYLICGLGNPGLEYDDTRHNVGFEVMDALVEKKSGTFKEERHGLLAEVKHKGRTLLLLKPMTYMNLSGKAVRYWMQKEKILPENLLVVLDDLNLPFGTIRLRKKGKDGGHNGLKDIDAHLGTQPYARLRVGIGNNYNKGRQVDYVLGKWSDEEQEHMPKIMKHCISAISSYAVVGIDRTMSQANKKVCELTPDEE